MTDAARADEETELNRELRERPKSVAAHIAMGDFRVRAGQEDLARHFYRTAIRLAECQEVPDDSAAEIGRIEEALAGIEATADARRQAMLRQRGLSAESWSPRFRESLDLAAGRRKHYRQEPTAYFYPGLAAIQFFEPADFDWTASIEAAAPAIRDELVDFIETSGTDEFRAYVQHSTVAPEADEALLGSRDWSILGLCENGWVSPKVVERCPRTWAAVLQAPVPRVSGWGPTVVFSLLRAGARIAPHSGMFNTRLICHLPLIVPKGCRFRVGNEIREWEEGKLMIFDDTIEHEAWNDGSEDRVVLIFDIWRPELSEQERYELTALFSD
jgi:aspartyl/asparaginyl beta-hydroxylase (cupin superfamily)